MKRALALIAIVLVSTTAPAALAAGGDASAAAESSVSFETQGSAIVDYAVGGETMAESIEVQSQQEAHSSLSLSVGADLAAVTGLAGSALSVESESGLQTTIRAESGATLEAHQNSEGSLVVRSDGEAQYAEVGLGSSASAEADGENRVVVTTASGTKGVFVATGDGSVTVNEDGNVSASLEGEGSLVFRAYPDGRDETDRQVESLIASGDAAASVYVTGEGSGTVQYDEETTVEVTERAQGRVSMAVNRTSHEGAVIVTSVAEGTFESAEDLQVSVDGEAAARASTMAELQSAANGGDTSRYMVRGSGSARTQTEVLVGVNHFSTRQMSMSDGSSSESAGDGGSDGSDGSDGGVPGADGPGFGIVAALAALLAAAALLIRR